MVTLINSMSDLSVSASNGSQKISDRRTPSTESTIIGPATGNVTRTNQATVDAGSLLNVKSTTGNSSTHNSTATLDSTSNDASCSPTPVGTGLMIPKTRRKSSNSSCSDMFFTSACDAKRFDSMCNPYSDKCPRCSQTVYPFEKIGPIKGLIYHKVCFKCIVCDRQLDLKSYFTNSVNLTDNQIYCQSHFPKSQRGHVDADNFHIRNVMKAPKAAVIQQLNLPAPTVDGRSVGIMHAVQAQNLLHNDKHTHQGHSFPVLPPELAEARKKISEYQRHLEEKQKQEEDVLFKKFHEERKREEEKVEKELDIEWKSNLAELCKKYEKACKTNGTLEQQISSEFNMERHQLHRTLTAKRNMRKKTMKQCLLEQERHQTADMVTRQSKEMLTLIQRKEEELMKSKGIQTIPKKPPPPVPATTRKFELYSDASAIEYVDSQAIQVAETDQESYTELIDKLVGNFTTDLEKARAIFRWITVKDLNVIDFKDNLLADSPMGILRGIKYGTETYHTLFMRLCSYAGLYCVNIKGHSKSFGYEPGLALQPDRFLNTWNSVLIDGEWRFVQCNWGARHLVMCKDKEGSEKTKNDKIEYEYDEHYFLTDADEFIFEFFPFDIRWQLLAEPLTLQQFEQLPFVRSLFFHYSLDFVNQKQADIVSDKNGACDIQLRVPEILKRELVFHSQLRVLCTDLKREIDNIDGVLLSNYVLHTVVGDCVIFTVHLPQRGQYHIEIFANMVTRDLQNMANQTYRLRCVCKYKLVCEVLSQRMHPLPECAHGEWGPEKAIRHYGWLPLSHKCAIIETMYSDVYILFRLPRKLRLRCKLVDGYTNNQTKNETNANDSKVYVLNDCILVIALSLPKVGQYGLDIFSRDLNDSLEKKVMSHCCKYLINRGKANARMMIGPSRKWNQDWGIVLVSHSDPLITALPNDDFIELVFLINDGIHAEFPLKFEGDTSQEGLNDGQYVSVNKSADTTVVRVNVQFPGRYVLTVTLNKISSQNSNLMPFFTYVIEKNERIRKN